MMTNAALWARLTAFEVDDDGVDFPFSARLARENGWTRGFAKRAVGEYKRFVYLAMVSPCDVTPSNIVDQVWHLHLTYTRSYWHEMCRDILGHPLHHGPTKGGGAEAERFHIQYEKTIALYESEFGHLPPGAFWPQADDRFAGARNQFWIDRRRYWLITKPKRAAALLAAVFISAVSSFAALIGAAQFALAESVPPQNTEPGALLLLIGFAIVVIILGHLARPTRRRRRQKHSDRDGASSGLGASCGGAASGDGHGHGAGGSGHGSGHSHSGHCGGSTGCGSGCGGGDG